MSVKPHVILVPGAWHRPDAYAAITSSLQLAGYTVTGVDMPSVVEKEADAADSFDTDIAAIREAMQAAIAGGDKVALIGHSYGGIPASQAIEGFEKDTAVMIYLCAFANPVKKSLMDMLGGSFPDWIVPEGKAVKAIKNKEIFYNDIGDEEAEQHAAKLLLHSPGTMHSKATYAAHEHVPSVYILCKQDAAIPLAAQEMMASQRGKWLPYSPITVDAGHIPFLAKKEETVTAVRRALGENV